MQRRFPGFLPGAAMGYDRLSAVLDQQLGLRARPARGAALCEGRLATVRDAFDPYARAVYNHCFRRVADWSAAEGRTACRGDR